MIKESINKGEFYVICEKKGENKTRLKRFDEYFYVIDDYCYNKKAC